MASPRPLAALTLALALLGPAPAAAGESAEEALLVDALTKLGEARLDDALSSIQRLVSQRPNFRLAQLVYGDLLLAKAGAATGFGALAGEGESAPRDLDGLRLEARKRLDGHLDRLPADAVPESVLALAPGHSHLLAVDLAKSRLHVLENRDGRLHRRSDHYVSIGKNGMGKEREGDGRTPVGVYFVSGFLHDERLPELYGAGAFPIDYPNPWDRRQGRTGYGIWIHGVPRDTYSRPPLASDGCVTLSNADFQVLRPLLEAAERPPVVLADRLEWVSGEDAAAADVGLEAALDAWRRDWESLDPEAYARHYAQDFSAGDRDRSAWLERKRRVNARKEFIRVRLDQVSMFLDPGDEDLALVVFRQDYDSSNYSGVADKRQYWRRGADGRWRIVYEGPA